MTESLWCLVPHPDGPMNPVALVKLSRKGNWVNILMFSCVGRSQSRSIIPCSISRELGLVHELSCVRGSRLS
jgi:hypothetical protein